MKIEYLAPYLPYDLQWKRCNKDNPKSELVYKVETMVGRHLDDNYCDYSTYEPILRPLSDLSKQLKGFDGNMLAWSFYNSEKDCYQAIINEEISLAFYKLLLQYHFDVFGLIPKGLAIDMNKINKE